MVFQRVVKWEQKNQDIKYKKNDFLHYGIFYANTIKIL